MAKNAKSAGRGEGYRDGSVKDRSQLAHGNGTFYKRDLKTGRFMSGKDTPYKGVALEQDGRKNPK